MTDTQDFAGRLNALRILGGLGRVFSDGGADLRNQVRAHARPIQTQQLRDGTVGYCARMTRVDDCWAAAVATCIQVPIEELPDPRLDERLKRGEAPAAINLSAWLEYRLWLADRGLGITVHRKVPAARHRWIGVVQFPGWFNHHCLVMSREEVLFDPVVQTNHSRPVRTYAASDVTFGYSFRAVSNPR